MRLLLLTSDWDWRDTLSTGFFHTIFHNRPDPSEAPDQFVRWGPAETPIYLNVEDLLQGNVGPSSTNLFYGPTLHSEPTGTKATVIGGGTAWCDYDGDTPATPLVKPSIVVASGGPNRHHFYWLLDRWVPPDELEDINKTLAKHLGQKGGEWDAARILRVPGTINTKYDPPKPVKLVAMAPEIRYDPEVLKKLGPVPKGLLEIPKGKTRSERDYAVARLLVHWGIPDDIIRGTLRMVSTKAREEPDSYLDITLKNAHENKDVPIEIIPETFSQPQGSRRGRRKQPDARALANFYLEPVGRLVAPDGTDEGIAVRVITSEGPQGEFPVTQKDFEGRRAVHNWLSSCGLKTLTWVGKDMDALELFGACVSQCPEVQILKVMAGGRYDVGDNRYFIYGRQDALCNPPPDPKHPFPILWSPNTEPPFSITLGTAPFSPDAVGRLISNVLETNTVETVVPALGWLMGVPLKPVFMRVGARYPILMVFGAKGSGKSTFLEECLLPLLGLSDVHQEGKISALGAGVSRFALLSNLAIYNAIPLWIGDFRTGLPNTEDLAQELRLAYDGHKEERGRADLTVSTWELSTPVVVDGEAVFPDAATRDRCIPIRMSQVRVGTETQYRQAYLRLRDQPREVFTAFAREYLTWCLTLGESDLRLPFKEAELAFGRKLPFSRAARNVAVVWVGFQLLTQFLRKMGAVPPALEEVTEDHFLKAMEHIYLKELGSRTAAELFSEIVASLFYQGVRWARDFCVWSPEEDTLWVHVTSAHHWVGHFRRSEIPSLEMLLPVLEERTGVYLEGPKALEERGGGTYWGINIAKAQELGLDVPRPVGAEERVITFVDDTGDEHDHKTITVNL